MRTAKTKKTHAAKRVTTRLTLAEERRFRALVYTEALTQPPAVMPVAAVEELNALEAKRLRYILQDPRMKKIAKCTESHNRLVEKLLRELKSLARPRAGEMVPYETAIK